MFVFRFEDSEGVGPFGSDIKEDGMSDEWGELESETGWNPYWGPGGNTDHNMNFDEIQPFVFGCPSIDEFNYWFPPAWQEFLESWGFQIKAFEMVPEDVFMSNSGTQCVFRRESAISETIL